MKVGIRERLIRAAVLAVALPATVQAADEAKPVQRYTFSWPLSSDPASAPRGGTTRGPEVELDRESSSAWNALQEADLTPFERDRRAILAMAGGYRVTFDFLETVDFRPTPTRERPYQSWGTYRVRLCRGGPR